MVHSIPLNFVTFQVILRYSVNADSEDISLWQAISFPCEVFEGIFVQGEDSISFILVGDENLLSFFTVISLDIIGFKGHQLVRQVSYGRTYGGIGFSTAITRLRKLRSRTSTRWFSSIGRKQWSRFGPFSKSAHHQY